MKSVLLGIALLGMAAAPTWAAIIADGGFETPVEPGSNYYYNATGGSWTFDSTSGIILPPSAFNGPNPAAEGNQYAFLQSNHGDGHYKGVNEGLIYQTVVLPNGGTYTLSLVNAWRQDQSSAAYDVVLDGQPVLHLQAAGNTWSANGGTFDATAGNHVFGFLSTGPSDTTTFLDQVTLTPEPATLALLGLGGLALLRRRR